MTTEVTQYHIYNQDLNQLKPLKMLFLLPKQIPAKVAFLIKAELFRIGDLLFSASQDIFKQLVMSGSQFDF